jgi:HNH/ENDO VII superfamily nuclease with conserved GHE residues
MNARKWLAYLGVVFAGAVFLLLFWPSAPAFASCGVTYDPAPAQPKEPGEECGGSIPWDAAGGLGALGVAAGAAAGGIAMAKGASSGKGDVKDVVGADKPPPKDDGGKQPKLRQKQPKLKKQPRLKQRAKPEPAKQPPRSHAERLRKGRPNYRKRMRFKVFKDAKRAPNGEDFVGPTGSIVKCLRDADGTALRFDERGRPDPNGFTIPHPNPPSGAGEPNFNFGHVPDSEYWRLVQLVEDFPERFTWPQILDEYNNPDHYRIEDPPTNVGHGQESTTPGYGHYGSMLNNEPNPPP